MNLMTVSVLFVLCLFCTTVSGDLEDNHHAMSSKKEILEFDVDYYIAKDGNAVVVDNLKVQFINYPNVRRSFWISKPLQKFEKENCKLSFLFPLENFKTLYTTPVLLKRTEVQKKHEGADYMIKKMTLTIDDKLEDEYSRMNAGAITIIPKDVKEMPENNNPFATGHILKGLAPLFTTYKIGNGTNPQNLAIPEGAIAYVFMGFSDTEIDVGF